MGPLIHNKKRMLSPKNNISYFYLTCLYLKNRCKEGAPLAFFQMNDIKIITISLKFNYQ